MKLVKNIQSLSKFSLLRKVKFLFDLPYNSINFSTETNFSLLRFFFLSLLFFLFFSLCKTVTTQLVQELIVALALSEKDKRIMIDYININNKCLSFFLLSTSIQMKICLYMDSETKNKTYCKYKVIFLRYWYRNIICHRPKN